MKALICTKFGPPDVLQLQEIARPTPGERDVLIRIHATTVTVGDCELRRLKFPLLFKLIIRIYVRFIRRGPMILGQEFAGEIEAVGKEVTRFSKEDSVIGWTGFGLGAYAEYKCLSEDGVLAIKPSTLSYEQAAPLPVGGLEAAYFLRRANIQSGQKVLINGAGGSIGTFAIQIARYFGAEVTGVDSTGKLDMLRSIGANHVIDYTRENFTRKGETYDVIFDVIGKSPFSRSIQSLTPNGYYLLANPRTFQRLRARWASGRSEKKVIPWVARSTSEHAEDFKFLTELIEAGKLQTVIDRCYPLEQAADAHRYVETGSKKGHVVIAVEYHNSLSL